MKVIVAGHQKTGTKTLNEALTILGYNVYDFLENYFYLGKEWKEIFKFGGGGNSTELFQKMYKDVDAVCDIPALAFWEEIHRAFPDAKIILTMRENEDVWYKSLCKQLEANHGHYMLRFIFLFSPSFILLIASLGSSVAQLVYGLSIKELLSKNMNETISKLSYRRHNAHVLMNAPKDKLLVYNCKEGWEPLCKFLEVDVPDVAFPHKNKGGSVFDDLLKSNDIMIRLKREAMIFASSLAVCVAAGVFVGLKYFAVI